MPHHEAAEDTFTEAFRTGWSRVASAAYGILGDVDLAKDVAQEAFMRTWDRFGGSPSPDPDVIQAYALATARHLSLNAKRDLARRQRALLQPLPPQPQPSPLDELSLHELEACLDKAVLHFPERLQQIYQLGLLGGQSNEEVAESLGLSPKTVANERARIRAALRRELVSWLPLRRRTGREDERRQVF